MAIPVLYAFMEDDALRLQGRLNLKPSDTDQGYGILSGEAKNYFVNTASIDDIRTSRLQILDSKRPYGNMRLLFDADQFDTSILSKMSDLELQRLFNIVERAYLQQNYSDGNIEETLTAEAAYTGYVENTFSHSTSVGKATVRDNSKGQLSISIYDWCAFEFLLGQDKVEEDEEADQSEKITFRIRFWVKRDGFKNDYPHTTVTSVIPPCDPKVLVDPLTLTSQLNLDLLSGASNFIFAGVNTETTAHDQNGTYVYSTKYVVDDSRVTTIPFALTYCGARIPSSLECRKAIREYLVESTGMLEDHLKAILPELYVQARFYIAPFWSWKKELADRVVYPSIWSVPEITNAVSKLWPDMDADFVQEHIEVFTHAADKILLIVVPDQLNDRYLSIKDIYPTYNDWSTTSANWRLLPVLTQDFANKVMRCMSVLKGEAVSEEFLKTDVDGVDYLSFTASEAEFLMMTELSYTKLMSVED